MPRAKLQIGVEAKLSLRHQATIQRLQLAGRTDLSKPMGAEIRKVGKPAVEEVKRRLRSAELPARPSRGRNRRSTGLRRRAANSVRVVTTRGGISVQAQGQKVDPRYGTSLVLALNGLAKVRHPVFGNRAAWVEQRGNRDHWHGVFDEYGPKFRAGVERVLDEFAAKIEG